MQDWEKVIAFHGHPCCLLAVGYRAAKLALDLLTVDFASRHRLIAVVENRTCAADAVQILTGCTFGKSNFLYRNYGKYVFTFGLATAPEAWRISLKPGVLEREGKDFVMLMEKVANQMATESEESEFYRRQGPLMEYILKGPADELFKIEKVPGPLVRPYLSLELVRCGRCGEEVTKAYVRVREGQLICGGCSEGSEQTG